MMDFEINYVRILGFNKKGQEYLKEIRENNKIENFNMENDFQKKNVFVNWKDIEKSGNFDKRMKIQKLRKSRKFLEKYKLKKWISDKGINFRQKREVKSDCLFRLNCFNK